MTASRKSAGPAPLNPLGRWVAGHPRTLLLVAAVGLLLPFCDKPFNLDDPLFVWTARQIQAHPANPYGFAVNWYGTVMPMAQVMQNPPLAGYFLAGAATILGGSERAFHLALLLPALAVILGTYRLAGQLCRQPWLAALAALSTPVFLISSTTVMCDVLMLAFWVWTIIWWVEGLARNDYSRLCLAGFLAGLAALTKYFGLCLLPLLLVYSLIQARGIDRRLVCLLIPVGMFGVYEFLFLAQYGGEPLFAAAGYAGNIKAAGGASLGGMGLTGLAFAGGCLAVAFFCAPALWHPRVMAGGAAVGGLAAATVFWLGGYFDSYAGLSHASHTGLEIQITIWAVGGIFVLLTTAGELSDRRDPVAWLLVLWVLGTFLFATFFNWTTNGRSLLPMAPVVGILLARQWDRVCGERRRRVWILLAGLAGSAGLGGFAARADYQLANAVHDCALKISVKHAHAERPLWFQGHWGFQYYMEENGAEALDLNNSILRPGDQLVIPGNNSNVIPPGEGKVNRVDRSDMNQSRWLATVSDELGANFYSSQGGVLPFVLGHVPPESAVVCALRPVEPSSTPVP